MLKKGKAVPLQAWGGPEGSRKLRFPDFMTTAQNGGKVFSPTHRPPLPPGNTPGTHFYWRLSRSQGHSAIGKIMSMKNSNDAIWNRTSDLPIYAYETDCDPVDTDIIYPLKKLKLITDNLCFSV